ncbi:uncharacterized protein EI97DRAFT_435698 [Westerdykella ornata]|uniref:Uncharacterized protein n=1 Tax=Westerdykella ornata TaxID=318751 RepID=A0A6A6JBY8_WESOR|nr:uncharacterized protein EI97DRAFT_435698 [Westerdykella ornata]KAF2273777.1 hypothetical protein EI97DRAFT_435698 [Westerdykella ornata]
MAQIHAPVSPPSVSNATHCSLRRTDRLTALPRAESVDWSDFDDVKIDAPLRPPPSALTGTSTHYDPHDPDTPLQDHHPGPGRGHQRSLTGTFLNNCQPFLARATSTLQQHTARAALHSPTKSLASFIPSRTSIGATASQPKIKAGARALQNWFNGTSGPVSLGLSAPDDSEDDDYASDDSEEEPEEREGNNMLSNIFHRGTSLTSPSPSSADTTTPKHPAPHAQPSSSRSSTTTSSRFAWPFPTSNRKSTTTTAPTYHNPSDELLTLNISQSLFPHGPVDPLAPSSFNDLVSTAEALLSRFQASYRQLSSALRDARAEQSAQEDELEEAETRVDLLKAQLEGMARRAEERDEEIGRLRGEVEWERRMRKEAERKWSGDEQQQQQQQQQRRRKRASNSDVSVDSGFFDDGDGDGESVRSACCVSPTTVDSHALSEEAHAMAAKMQGPQLLQSHDSGSSATGTSLCANCANGSQASVWARLAREREESQVLRRRVEVLEKAVEGALDVVDGPWGLR